MKTRTFYKVVLLSVLLLPMAAMAQSTDAAYPVGHWWNESEDTPQNGLAVDIFIYRSSSPNKDFGGVMDCGSLTVTDRKTEKVLVDGVLIYDGKELANNMPTGAYHFILQTKDGKQTRMTLTRFKGLLLWSQVSGALANHSFFKEKIWGGPNGMGHYADPTPDCENDKEVIQALREAPAEANIDGFGDRALYVRTHANLDFTKPKYCKPKGTGAINIRKDADVKAAKVGELTAGNTLLVVDEYNGWCKVQMQGQQTGWVSLSVVTLTNIASTSTAGGTTAASGSSETVCPLVGVWSGILGGGWGDSAVGLKADKKKGNNFMMPNQLSNGSISMSDEEFINERNYNLQFVRTISPNCYEFVVQRMVGKQIKSGKLQIQRKGKKIMMTGLDAWAKQQPFHNRSLEESNL